MARGSRSRRAVGLAARPRFQAATRSRGKGSGIEVEERYALIYQVKGDKIVRMTMYGEPAEALEAVGLSSG